MFVLQVARAPSVSSPLPPEGTEASRPALRAARLLRILGGKAATGFVLPAQHGAPETTDTNWQYAWMANTARGSR